MFLIRSGYGVGMRWKFEWWRVVGGARLATLGLTAKADCTKIRRFSE